MEDQNTVVAPVNPFGKDGWSETAPTIETTPVVIPPAQTEPPKQEEKKTEEGSGVNIVTPSLNEEPFYKKIGFEKEEDVVNEITTLREKAAKGYEYKNDESKKLAEYINEGKIDDLYSFLDTQKRVDKLSKADLTDKNIAAELVKFGIKKDNPTLDDNDVDFLFNQRYSIPEKPIQGDDLDEDFQPKLDMWKRQAEQIERGLVIEAKMQQPKMAQLKSELVLPDIKREIPDGQKPPTQEELQKGEEARKNYLAKLESDYKNFNGYEVKYKDEEVEIPISFVVPDEEKIALKKELENFDVDGFIGNRWFNKDGSPNITQMMDDVTLLRNKEKAFQKIANEVGAKMKLHYMEKKSNVSVNGSQPVINQTQQNPLQEEIAYLWKQK